MATPAAGRATVAAAVHLVRPRRLALLVAGLLAGACVSSLALAAEQHALNVGKKFKVSRCDYQYDQGCPAVRAPNSCRFKGQAKDRRCTPGVLNPAVTQSTIKQTVCRTGWTSTIRPPTSYTDPLKRQELRAYGDGGKSPSGFELDHLISLELGGAPSDPRNLWPESHKNSFNKDGLENSLRAKVCSGFDQPGQGPAANCQLAEIRQSEGSRRPRRKRRRRRDRRWFAGQELLRLHTSTQAEAQSWFVSHGGSASNDVACVDADHDGVACESLP